MNLWQHFSMAFDFCVWQKITIECLFLCSNQTKLVALSLNDSAFRFSQAAENLLALLIKYLFARQFEWQKFTKFNLTLLEVWKCNFIFENLQIIGNCLFTKPLLQIHLLQCAILNFLVFDCKNPTDMNLQNFLNLLCCWSAVKVVQLSKLFAGWFCHKKFWHANTMLNASKNLSNFCQKVQLYL